jgi:hypothetical protein
VVLRRPAAIATDLLVGSTAVIEEREVIRSRIEGILAA